MANTIAFGIWYHLLWIGGFGLALAAAEYLWPAGQRPTFTALAGNILVVVLVIGILGLASVHLGSFYDWLALSGLVGVVFGEWHPQTIMGLIVISIVNVFVWDFFQYWFHRAEHKFAILWPVHALHHDDESVNWSTSQRNTIWSALLHVFLVNVPTVMVCGLNLVPIAGAYLLFKTYGLFNHANIRVDLGFLTPVISGPQWHRIHHGRDEEYFNKNFAAFFPVLDILFGTYRRPLPNEYPATGLSDRRQASLSLKHLLQNVFGIAVDRNSEKAIDPNLNYSHGEPTAPVR